MFDNGIFGYVVERSAIGLYTYINSPVHTYIKFKLKKKIKNGAYMEQVFVTVIFVPYSNLVFA